MNFNYIFVLVCFKEIKWFIFIFVLFLLKSVNLLVKGFCFMIIVKKELFCIKILCVY